MSFDHTALISLGIKEAAKLLKKKDICVRDLAEAYLREIEKNDCDIGAYIEVFEDVREQAQACDKALASKKEECHELTGVPFAIKDNILISGREAAAASKILRGYTAAYDATVIKKLKEKRALFLGRGNMDEFAMGSSTEHSAFHITRNPYDKTRVPGGSSGGPAAAVAARCALGALGSDTGGSIRQPASFCGVVGLKPTYGSVSRSGLIAMASSLDQIGPIAGSVTDAEIIFEAIKGKDPLDSTSYMRENAPLAVHGAGPIRVGIPWDFFEDGVDDDVKSNFEQSINILKDRGAEIRGVDMKSIRFSLASYYIIMPAEASSNLARYDGVRFGLHKGGANLLEDYIETRTAGFGPEVKRRVLLGAYVLSAGYYDAYYGSAVAMRRVIESEFAQIFGKDGVDIIATPTTPSPAFKIGEKTQDPLSMYLADLFTVPANIAGVPAISVPSGFAERDGVRLPLGLQLMSAWDRESMLFHVGKIFLGEEI